MAFRQPKYRGNAGIDGVMREISDALEKLILYIMKYRRYAYRHCAHADAA